MGWQSEKIQFINNGLDILSDTLDMQPGYYRKLTNVESIQEGSISGRNGVIPVDAGYFTAPIHSIYRVKDAFNLTSTTLVGCGTTLYANGTELETGFSGESLSFAPYRPEKVNFPVIYVGDATKMKKVFYRKSESKWISQDIGIAPPPYPIAMDVSSITSTTYTSVCTMSSMTNVDVHEFINQGIWTSTIPAMKATATVAPGAGVTVFHALTSPATLHTIYFPVTTSDCDKGTSGKSKVEFFIKISDYTGISGLRLSLFHSDLVNGYVFNFPMDEILSYMPGSGGMISQEVDTSPIEYGWITVTDPYDGNQSQVWGVLDVPIRSTTTITTTVNSWATVSIDRDKFVRVGQDASKNWSNISGVLFEFTTTATASFQLQLYDLTLTKSPGLDSSAGMPYKWRYTYWNDELGIESNPCEEQAGYTNAVNKIVRMSMLPSSDPQVTHVNLYRLGGTLGSYHLVERIGNKKQYHITHVSTAPAPALLTVTCEASTPSLFWGDQVLITSTASVLDNYWQIIPTNTSPGLETRYMYLIGSSTTPATGNMSGTLSTYIYEDSTPDQNIIYNPILALDRNQPITTFERRTNLITSSENVNTEDYNLWTSTFITKTKADVLSPIGGTSYSIAATSLNAILRVGITVPTGEGGYYTFSFYAKRIIGTGVIEMTMDSDGGIFEKISFPQFPDERWQRYFITKYMVNGMYNPGIRIVTSGDSIGVYGFQFEKADRLKPYIPTYDSTSSVLDGTKLGSPLPVLFGPYMGKYVFGLGDPNSPGTLYWCNPQYPDYWSPLNAIEVTQPDEPLITGGIFDGRVFVFSIRSMYVIYPSMTAASTFQVLPTAVQAGINTPDAIAIGDAIYFSNRYGLYASNGGTEVCISDQSLIRPIFKNRDTSPDYQPIDFDYPVKLAYLNPNLYMTYRGALDGRSHMMVYNSIYKRWTAFEFGTRKMIIMGHEVDIVPKIKDVYKIYPDYSEGEVYLGMGISTSPTTWKSAIHKFSDDNFSDNYKWDANTTSTCPVFTEINTGGMDQGNSRIVKQYGDLFIGMDNDIPVYVDVKIDEEVFLAEEKIVPGISKTNLIPIVSYSSFKHSGVNESTFGRFISLHFSWEQDDKTISEVEYHRTAILKYAEVSYAPQGEEVRSRPTEWSDLGVPVQKYIWGVNLDLDSYGSSLNMMVFADGVLAHEFVIPAAVGRRKYEASWPEFQAYQVSIKADTSTSYILYAENWLFKDEKPLISGWNNYWTAFDQVDGYLTGFDLEGDTKSVDKELVLQRDGGEEIYRGTVNLDGHTVTHVTFPAVICKTVRLLSTDDTLGFLYKISWRVQAEPPLQEVWDSNYEQTGDLQERWLTALYMEADTEGAAKPVDIVADGKIIHQSAINSNGRGPVKISIPPTRCVLMKFTSNSVPGRLYRYKWIFSDEPYVSDNFIDNWSNIDYPYEKLAKAITLDISTFGLDKTFYVCKDDDESDRITEEFTVNHESRRTAQFAIDNVLFNNIKVVSSDNVPCRLYSIKYDVDREPPLLDLWQTQPMDFDINSFSHIREIYITLKAESSVQLILNADGRNYNYSVTSSKTDKEKIRVQIGSIKAKLWKFKFVSEIPFKIYVSDSVVYVKSWNTYSDYKMIQIPFSSGV